MVTLILLLSAFSQKVVAGDASPRNPSLPLGNRAVLASIKELPEGGGYSTRPAASSYLKSAIELIAAGYRPPTPGNTFCSSATYMALLSSLKKMEMGGHIRISPDCWSSLKTTPLPDGHGPWGLWNSNGPGAAGLLQASRLGWSFTEIEMALPGDFLKFFWTPAIGKRERGHLVVFLGMGERTGRRFIKYWSANRPEGMGVKEAWIDEIHNPIFSRLSPDDFWGIPPASFQDKTLVEMKTKNFRWDQVVNYLSSAPAGDFPPPAPSSSTIISNVSTQ